MARGVVKWFSDKKGYGFVVDEDNGKEVFVHYSVIQHDGYKSLYEGEEVEFSASNGPKGEQADWVTKIDSKPMGNA